MDLVEELGEDVTCDDLMADKDFCSNVEHCIMEADHCAYESCSTSIDAYFECDAASESLCPGLCEEEFGFALNLDFAIA